MVPRRSLCLALATVFLAALPAAAAAAERTTSATGVAEVEGANVYVEVFVQVPDGQSARQAAGAALADQGARPVQQSSGPGGPGFTGLVWDVLPVPQSYNPAGDPVGAGSALGATQAAWSSVPGSDFAISSGGQTSRCPSIVQECPGPQVLDGFNDVGWARLSPNTLGVTWSTTGGVDEADMALNTRVPWSAGCIDVAGRFDVQTVLLHENGHVAGLDHATSTASVMYPSYQAARCSLGALDQDAISTLYPGR
jgi:Matrixin